MPAGTLAGLDLCGSDDTKLGTLDGILIDPANRRLRYFVIESQGWLGKKRFLLSADEPAHLERGDSVLRVDVDTHEPWRETFDADSVRSFTEDDLITAIFSTTHAA
jgi:hypothetical protein